MQLSADLEHAVLRGPDLLASEHDVAERVGGGDLGAEQEPAGGGVAGDGGDGGHGERGRSVASGRSAGTSSERSAREVPAHPMSSPLEKKRPLPTVTSAALGPALAVAAAEEATAERREEMSIWPRWCSPLPVTP